jgi:membrane carboxypeptidase/penicillin-binding protein
VQADAEQVLLGINLGFSYPEAEIVRMYADVIYFGHGYYGLAAASCGYFGKGRNCPGAGGDARGSRAGAVRR